MKQIGQHAIVIGASIGGLLAARALSARTYGADEGFAIGLSQYVVANGEGDPGAFAHLHPRLH